MVLYINYLLIYWPSEDSVTAVPSKSIVEPSLRVGEYCKVKYARNVYDGRVIAIGKCNLAEEGTQLMASISVGNYMHMYTCIFDM